MEMVILKAAQQDSTALFYANIFIRSNNKN